jgi:hypothetical protein
MQCLCTGAIIRSKYKITFLNTGSRFYVRMPSYFSSFKFLKYQTLSSAPATIQGFLETFAHGLNSQSMAFGAMKDLKQSSLWSR